MDKMQNQLPINRDVSALLLSNLNHMLTLSLDFNLHVDLSMILLWVVPYFVFVLEVDR